MASLKPRPDTMLPDTISQLLVYFTDALLFPRIWACTQNY